MPDVVFLMVGAVEFPVAEASESEGSVLGQSSRAFDNTMRTTERATGSKGSWTFTSPFLSPTEYATLAAAIPRASLRSCYGPALGDAGVLSTAPMLCLVKRGTVAYGYRAPSEGITHDRTMTITVTEV